MLTVTRIGFDLISEPGIETQVRPSVWTFHVNLAMEYGWKLAGTLMSAGFKERIESAAVASNRQGTADREGRLRANLLLV